ncbi:transporter substrate-binding domain-containing protein [Aeromonas veronii]|uniref:transporter substrate-binding domain-containing protein n=1 Tax=Aeromonas veronii TaxID=654 RepID=UPI003982A983
MIKKLILSTLLFCGIATAAPPPAPTSTLDAVLERGVLRVGFDAGYQPFEMTNKQGQYIGFDVDLAKMVAKEMGVKVEFVNTAWDGIIPALLTNKFDVIMGGMTVTPQRNLRVNFADPYIVVGQTIVLRKEKAGEIKSFTDLNDPKYKIAVKLGTTGEQAVKRLIPKATLLQFETQDDAKLEVINGKVDAFVYDLPYNAIFASQNQGAVVHLDKPFTFEPLAWAIRKGDQDTLNWFNNYLRQIKGDGSYDRLYKKWFESNAWLNQLK